MGVIRKEVHRVLEEAMKDDVFSIARRYVADEGLRNSIDERIARWKSIDSEFYHDNPLVRDFVPDSKWGYDDYFGWLEDRDYTVTARFRKVWIDPRKLIDLPGARDEHLTLQGDDEYEQNRVQDLVDKMGTDGYREDRPVMLEVLQNGTVRIYEGNHRVRAAVRAGIDKIPAEVVYRGGAELLPDVFDPTHP